jgi:hypothetical protein
MKAILESFACFMFFIVYDSDPRVQLYGIVEVGSSVLLGRYNLPIT